MRYSRPHDPTTPRPAKLLSLMLLFASFMLASANASAQYLEVGVQISLDSPSTVCAPTNAYVKVQLVEIYPTSGHRYSGSLRIRRSTGTIVGTYPFSNKMNGNYLTSSPIAISSTGTYYAELSYVQHTPVSGPSYPVSVCYNSSCSSNWQHGISVNATVNQPATANFLVNGQSINNGLVNITSCEDIVLTPSCGGTDNSSTNYLHRYFYSNSNTSGDNLGNQFPMSLASGKPTSNVAFNYISDPGYYLIHLLTLNSCGADIATAFVHISAPDFDMKFLNSSFQWNILPYSTDDLVTPHCNQSTQIGKFSLTPKFEGVGTPYYVDRYKMEIDRFSVSGCNKVEDITDGYWIDVNGFLDVTAPTLTGYISTAGDDPASFLEAMGGGSWYYFRITVTLETAACGTVSRAFWIRNSGNWKTDPVADAAAGGLEAELFPNPIVDGRASLGYTLGDLHNEVSLRLYDMQGRQLETLLEGESRYAGFQREEFDLSGLPEGVYLYELSVNGQSVTGKLLKAAD